ncbi:brachyurin-like [Neocloeon triangulifer]|uniref:brachyurin-like n=1 Tax=Neocloeon triangulifer TaxID=2078957 RepID=UPI00286F623A|nr:brachyurin-like [Neocloeon triangulifer]
MRRLELASVLLFWAQLAQSVSIGSRVVGGQEATPGAYPWQIYAEGFANGQVVYGCGGTLISDRHVLTAAQCFEGAQIVRVYLGAHNVSATNEPNRVIMETTDFTIHPEFSTNYYDNDIAVITLPRQVTINTYIDVANLPTGGDVGSDFLGAEGVFAGWGSSDGINSLTSILRFSRNTVVSKVECEAHYGVNWMSAAKLCVETANQAGPCYGDAGSALIRESDKTIIGIFSFLDKLGCLNGFAVGFTRVGQYVDWINGIVNGK